MLIVLGNRSLASYPDGGGHWSWFLQYPLGLKALGHRVFWLEVLKSSGDRGRDSASINNFFSRIAEYGLESDCALMLVNDLDVQDIGRAELFGQGAPQLAEVGRDADLMWNLACAIRPPILSMFRRRALVDVDPGHLQISATQWELGIKEHQVHLTVGSNIHQADCEVPILGLRWHCFLPFVFLAGWPREDDPPRDAPFSSITQWTWEVLYLNGRELSASKRAAYLRYADLPRLAARPFELAVNLGGSDPANDRERLIRGGWCIADPHSVAPTPSRYRAYLRDSRAEIQCPKPVFRELRTGWFSDRSVAYLATGRPVIAEETGFSTRIPTGRGIIAFSDMKEAVAAVAEIDANYPLHSRAAREIACDLFDSKRQLNAMITACA